LEHQAENLKIAELAHQLKFAKTARYYKLIESNDQLRVQCSLAIYLEIIDFRSDPELAAELNL
jgi:hypothetical protein